MKKRILHNEEATESLMQARSENTPQRLDFRQQERGSANLRLVYCVVNDFVELLTPSLTPLAFSESIV